MTETTANASCCSTEAAAPIANGGDNLLAPAASGCCGSKAADDAN